MQDALRERILAGDTAALFKAVEIVHGKPRQALEVDQALAGGIEIRWQDDLTARLEAGRRRVAEARRDPTEG